MAVQPASPAGGTGTPAIPPQALQSSKNLQANFPTAAAFATWLDSKNSTPVPTANTNIPHAATLGAQWTAWYAKGKPANPQYTLGEFEYTFLSYAEFAGLGAAIVNEAETLGTFTGAAAQATVTGVTGVASWESGLTSFLSALGSATLWVRVAKVVIGGTLLIVGAAKLTGVDKQVATVGKVVAKAPLL